MGHINTGDVIHDLFAPPSEVLDKYHPHDVLIA